MIITEFRRITGADDSSDVRLCVYSLPSVPDRGECINIKGTPYVVHERGWSVDSDSEMYCHIRLSPLQGVK